MYNVATKLLVCKIDLIFSLAQQLETSNQPSPRGHLFVTQTIPDILAQHSNGAQSPKCFSSGTEARSCLVSRSFWFIRKERSLDERKIRAMEVKCVTCWGVRACPMFWATSVDWSQQRRGPRDHTWKDCRNEIPIAQLQPRTHNTRTISDEALCIWGKNRKV